MPDDDLFGSVPEYTRSRTDDLPTSKKAANRVMRSINDKHRKVQAAHRMAKKGMTDWALEEMLMDHGATYRTRRQELSDPTWFNPPYILNSGKTKREPNSSHPQTERVIWVWHEYYEDPHRELPPVAPPPLPPTNAYYDKEGRLIHDTCAVDGCAKKPAFAVGQSLLRGRLGMYYCLEHWRELKEGA